MNDMATQAVNWVRFQQSLTPDKPFFVYFAPGAVHAPHHVPQKYIDKQKGRFDAGWDVIRQRIFENQKRLGVIPPDTKLADKPKDIKDWADLSAYEKKLFARQAEVFAAYLDMTDTETGRLIQAIEDMGELDNTLIFYIAGDNGTSAEGLMNGLYNEMTYFNAEPKGSDVDFMMKYYDAWGDPDHLPAHGGGLGGLLRFAVHLDQAGGLQLRRNSQRPGCPLARRHQGRGRDPHTVAPRDRRRADRPGSLQAATTTHRQRCAAAADRRREHGSTASTMPELRTGTRSSTSKCSATAESISTAGLPARFT